ncbi:hypothetical protein HQ489_02530 [Candidatus Woesearchaeota archaeon]|nr:hypothetical protein [Candidatus Woesearchaeota archaeon]
MNYTQYMEQIFGLTSDLRKLYVLASFVKPETLNAQRLAEVSGRNIDETQSALDFFVESELMKNTESRYDVIQKAAGQSLVFINGVYDERLPKTTIDALIPEVNRVYDRCFYF